MDEFIVKDIRKVRYLTKVLYHGINKYMRETELVERDEDNLDFLLDKLEDIIDMYDVSLERIGRTS